MLDLPPSRVFGAADQTAFAELSGDHNPIHVDELAARRLLFGGPLVHGIHVALWALDAAIADADIVVTDLDVTFRRPIRVGEPCQLAIDADPSGATVEVLVHGRAATRLTARWRPTAASAGPTSLSPAPVAAPRSRVLADLVDDAGGLPLAWDRVTAAALLPRLSASIPPWQVAVLLATTRMVGMECPGEHSLYSSLRLGFTPVAQEPSELRWAVTKVEHRSSRVLISLAGDGVAGDVVAFVRPRPQAQPSAAELTALVDAGELAGVRLLVVGGTRGLGEVTAKLAAVAGADVRLTWHRGQADAEAVCADIRAAGGTAAALPFDVTATDDRLELHGWEPTHLAWFATPYISLADTTRYSPELFHSYCSFFVDGLVRVVDQLAPSAARPLGLLYPSSTALDEILPKAMEYAAAKAAGEAVCHHLAKLHPSLHVVAPRLPRLATDQTTSLMAVPADDPARTLLPLLRELCRSGLGHAR